MSFAARKGTWPAQLGVAEAKAKYPADHYKTLLAATLREETIVQIDKDLPRTMDHELLKQGSPMRDSLRRVLLALAAHDTVLGYVQSMNFIAAFLLLTGMDEEEAFWCLTVIIYKVIPGYFSDGMARIFLDGRVFGALLHLYLPAVGLQLQELSAATGDESFVLRIITQQWLQTLFVNVLPEDCTLAVWDLLVSTRDRHALFCAALALLQPAQERICAALEMGNAVELMQALGGELKAPEAQSAFLERMGGYAGTLNAQSLRLAVGRELGEHGPVPGLERAEDLVQLTDIVELFRGLRSVEDLREQLAAPSTSDDEALRERSLMDQEAALQGMSADSKDGPAILSADELFRLTQALRSVGTKLAEMPTLRNSIRQTVHIAVNFPLGLLMGRAPKLPQTMSEFERSYAAWDASVAAHLAAPKLAGIERERPQWEQWVGGATEAHLKQAETLLQALHRAVDQWKTVVIEMETPEETSASSMIPKKERIAMGAAAAGPVEAAVAAHCGRIGEDLAALRAGLAAKIEAAKTDLPAVRGNAKVVHDWLADRSAKAHTGAREYAGYMEKKRAVMARSLAADLAQGQVAAGTALQAAAAAAPAAGQMGFADEKAHLDAYLAALEETRRAVAGRQKRIGREEAALASLQQRAAAHAAADQKRVAAAEAAARQCIAHLEKLADPGMPARAQELVAAMHELCVAVAAVWREKLTAYAMLIEESTVGLGMNYLTLANRADEELAELSARMGSDLKAAIERDANKVSVRKELGALAKGIGKGMAEALSSNDGGAGRGGGLFSGLGFGRKEANAPAPPATPTPAPLAAPDLISMDDGGSPGGAPAAAEDASVAGEPRKKSKAERELEAQLQNVAERKAALAEKKNELSMRTMEFTTTAH